MSFKTLKAVIEWDREKGNTQVVEKINDTQNEIALQFKEYVDILNYKLHERILYMSMGRKKYNLFVNKQIG